MQQSQKEYKSCEILKMKFNFILIENRLFIHVS